MHPFFQDVVLHERNRMKVFVADIKKAFDLLGNTYAPFFFCCAMLAGITLPIIALKSGDVVNALLGARGIGVLTSELVQSMWIMVGAATGYLTSQTILARLEGKMREVFANVTRIAASALLLCISVGAWMLFVFHAAVLTLWHVCVHRTLRWLLVVGWGVILVSMFFHLASTVALRVRTMGDAMSMLGIMLLVFLITTMSFLMKR